MPPAVVIDHAHYRGKKVLGNAQQRRRVNVQGDEVGVAGLEVGNLVQVVVGRRDHAYSPPVLLTGSWPVVPLK
jgi:hypothetical protein